MSVSVEKLHGPEGGRHACLNCHRDYWCEQIHFNAGDTMMIGFRYCQECRMRMLADRRRLGL